MYNITMIVAVDKNLTIGKNNDIPWAGKLRKDMEHFRDTTTGHTVVMGRKTYDSIRAKFKPLPNRVNIILSKQQLSYSGCLVVSSPGEILELSRSEEVFVAGGGEIYGIFLPYAKKLIVTHVDTVVEDPDTFFPVAAEFAFSRQLFVQAKDEKNHFDFSVSEYVRASS